MASSKRLLWKAETRTVGRTWELTVHALGGLGPSPAGLSALACWPLENKSVLWCWGTEFRVLYLLSALHSSCTPETKLPGLASNSSN